MIGAFFACFFIHFAAKASLPNLSPMDLLSAMYANGPGLLHDKVYTHMWGSIAANNGNTNGRKTRDFIAKRMTLAQITEVQKLARE